MLKKKFLIAGGNSTLLAWDCPAEKKRVISKKYLKEVEQVGFVSMAGPYPKLTMMGEELCINATVAFASQLGEKGILKTSGLSTSLVNFQNKNGETQIEMDLSYKRSGQTVIFEGIGFECKREQARAIEKNEAAGLAKKYNLPAFGLIFYRNGKISPQVYVKETNSLKKETACGSGSIAARIIFGRTKIIQPTGEIIMVKLRKNKCQVCARVTEIKSNFL